MTNVTSKMRLATIARMSLWAAIFQHVRIILSHHGNKLNSTSLAAGITLLAMQRYFIKDALLQICH